MKPINDLAFNNICLDFSCSCMNFCSEATYITMEEIAHDCDPIHYEDDEVENNFIENIVLKIYKMVMNKEDFKEYITNLIDLLEKPIAPKIDTKCNFCNFTKEQILLSGVAG